MRVVPNLYPALRRRRRPGEDPLAGGRGEPNLFAAQPALGDHEVIVNAPDPVHSLAELSPEQVEAAMSVWRERMRAHADAAYVHVIVNEGKEAGASLPHTHAQLYALPFVPAAVARERERFTAYSDRTQGRNLLEDVLQEEVRAASASSRSTTRRSGSRPFGGACRSTSRSCRAALRRASPTTALGARLLHESLQRLGAMLGSCRR